MGEDHGTMQDIDVDAELRFKLRQGRHPATPARIVDTAVAAVKAVAAGDGAAEIAMPAGSKRATAPAAEVVDALGLDDLVDYVAELAGDR